MLLAAMLAMVMVAAAPALAQDVQYDDDTQIVQCVQIIGGQYVDQAALADASEVAQEAGVSVEAVQNCIAAGEGAAVNVVTGEIVDGGDGEAATLPDTGGASLLALGAGALLVAGGLLARRIVR